MQGLHQAAHRDYLDAISLERASSALGHDTSGEAELGGLVQAFIQLRNRAQFTAQSYLADERQVARNGFFSIAGRNGGGDGEVSGRLADSQATHHIHKDILIEELETHALAQHREE